MRSPAVIALLLLVAAGCTGEIAPGRKDRGVRPPERGPARDSVSGRDRRPPDRLQLPVLVDFGPVTPDQGRPPDVGSVAGDLGVPCTGPTECIYKICIQETTSGWTFCSKPCNPCSTPPCPTGNGCQLSDVGYICVPGFPDLPCQ